ncbi:hypothetical protein JS756_04815 [Streptomyces actuosus]|uniref:Uncharacterized protein n=1 Tax=Streptomyces actuosus TaxID=1885 RepID=A0ABS2VK05_STRAS|nr:hypothetical protein [Streptomyces actuosus]MBN0043432.1 hypothetical protein [Streptomyces actuosus]
MAEGDAVAGSGVRVRLDGGVGGSDVSALKTWLEQEQPLAELIRAHRVTVEERHRTDEPDGRHMGLGTEILLVIVGSTATVTATSLIEHVERAVKAWLANRRQVESGEPPRPTISELDSDES